MKLNNICLSILKFLSENKCYHKISDLGAIFCIPERTVRYNLDKIDDFFLIKGYKKLDRKYGDGVKMPEDEEQLSYINNFFITYTPSQYEFSNEERKVFIISEILQSNYPLNIDYFESILSVSKSTIIKDLDEIEILLKDLNLTLERIRGVGLYITGDEKNKRMTLSKINSEIISIDDLFNYISTGKSSNKINSLQFENIFLDIDIDYIDGLIREVEKRLCRKFSDTAYSSLIIHIAIMIKRIQINRTILPIEAPLSREYYAMELEASKHMIEKIEFHFNIDVPESEINYIALHLIGSKVTEDNFENGKLEMDELTTVVNEMVNTIEDIYNISFGSSRQSLMEGLILHLRPAINRIKFNLNIKNPIYDEIVNSYSDLYEMTKLSCMPLEQYIGKPISSQEISYIVLHFGAALRSVQKESPSHRIVLVCATGLGTSKMLVSQITNKYDAEITKITSVRGISQINHDEYDFIVSTINIPGLNSKDYIKVNPILTNNDYRKLNRYLKIKSSVSMYNTEESMVEKIINIVEKHVDIDNVSDLKDELYTSLPNIIYGNRLYDEKGLMDYLEVSNIRSKVKAKDCLEAIDIACDLLINKGSILEFYRESIKERLKKLGPYMVIMPGVALLHTDICSGALKTDFALITLNEGVNFGNKKNDPVDIVFVFSSANGKEHVPALRELTNVLSIYGIVETMLMQNTEEDLLKLLNRSIKE